MDFHTFSRRDLQALCKKNKIPANMTNVAMADALQSLQTVEGLGEVLANPATETPAKSMAATPSVYRNSNRQRTIKEEPQTSNLTRTRRGTTKKAEAETAQRNPSACVNVSMAENSSVQYAYSTRRSTRLLEKQMCQLSLKENEDMVDAKAILEKDSQDMQKQFSEDMDNSLAPDNKISDGANITKEVPVQFMDVVLENHLPSPVDQAMKLKIDSVELDSAADKIEESNYVEVPVQNMDETSIIANASNEVDESIIENECKDDDLMQEDAIVLQETQDNTNDSMLGSESVAIEKAACSVVPQEFVDQLVQSSETEDDELVQEVADQLVQSSETEDDELVQEVADQLVQSSEAEDDEFDFLSGPLSDSESDNGQEVEQQQLDSSSPEQPVVLDGISEKPAKFPLGLTTTLQDENMSVAAATGTPIEKKSLRQLKKMVKEIRNKKQQAAEPLQEHTENVQ